MSNRNRLIPMSGYGDDIEAARKSTREMSLLALERQLAILQWMETVASVESYHQFMRVYGYRKVEDQGTREALGTMLHKDVQKLLTNAPTYYVSHDMVEMVQMAAEAMPPEGLSPIDLPSPTGFLSFDHPLVIEYEDDHGHHQMRLSAFAWEDTTVVAPEQGTSVPGVQYFLYLDPEDYVQANFNHPPEPGVTITEEDLATFTAENIKRMAGPMPIYDFSGWRYGQPWNSGDPDDIEGTLNDEGRFVVAPVVDSTRRALLTVWKMLQQKIVALETQRPYRALRRRGAQYMPDMGDIVVISLRKEYNPGAKYAAEHGSDDEQFEGPWYSHRFLVKGHWKRQRFGEGGADRKIIWVNPYIKGDPSLPLILKDKVFSLEQ